MRLFADHSQIADFSVFMVNLKTRNYTLRGKCINVSVKKKNIRVNRYNTPINIAGQLNIEIVMIL